MLPKERVFAALEHREPDRIPWGEHSIDYNVFEDILGRSSLTHAKMRETQAMWDGGRDEVVASYKRDILDLVRALEFDIVTVSGVAPKDYKPAPFQKLDEETYKDEKGNLWRVSSTTHDLMPFEINREAYVAPTIESIEKAIDDLDKTPLDPNDSAWEVVRHAVKEMKKTHFIMCFCPEVDWPWFGATDEDQFMSLLLYPDICRKLAELQGKQAIRAVELFAKLGVDGIMPPGDLGSSTGMLASPAIYREMMYPWQKLHAEAAHKHGLKILKHCCGNCWPVVDELAEIYDAWEGIQASAGMDIRKLKERVGDKLCLWGGIWHEHIILGSIEDIRKDAAYAFKYAAPGGGYIMGSTHSLAVDARRENLLEMKRCRNDWGVYPINPKKFR
jgi:uroporphyrinogen decarboxylase